MGKDSTFDPGESFNYTCSLSGLTGTSFHNVIDVTDRLRQHVRQRRGPRFATAA